MDVNSFVIGYTKGKQSAGGGGAELNIAYGDTPPEDTTKLWVKTSEPSGIVAMDKDKVGISKSYSLTESASVPTTDYTGGSGVEVDGKIYIFYKTNPILCYDPLSKVFTNMPCALPESIYGFGCAAVGKKIYIFGGRTGDNMSNVVSTIKCFDVETQEIKTLTERMPLSTGCSAVTVGTNILIVGASGGSSSLKTSNLYSFDTITEKVTALQYTMPEKVNLIASGFAYGSKVYVKYSTTIYEIDPIEQTAQIWGTTPELSGGSTLCLIGKKCCTFGTVPNSSPTQCCVLLIDLETKERELVLTAPLLGRECQFSSSVYVVCNKTLYIFYGSYNNNTTASNIQTKVHEFRIPIPDIDVASETLLIATQVGRNNFSIVNSDVANIEVGVYATYKGNEEGKGEEVEAALYKDGAWTTI